MSIVTNMVRKRAIEQPDSPIKKSADADKPFDISCRAQSRATRAKFCGHTVRFPIILLNQVNFVKI